MKLTTTIKSLGLASLIGITSDSALGWGFGGNKNAEEQKQMELQAKEAKQYVPTFISTIKSKGAKYHPDLECDELADGFVLKRGRAKYRYQPPTTKTMVDKNGKSHKIQIKGFVSISLPKPPSKGDVLMDSVSFEILDVDCDGSVESFYYQTNTLEEVTKGLAEAENGALSGIIFNTFNPEAKRVAVFGTRPHMRQWVPSLQETYTKILKAIYNSSR
ncbi:MAG: hypothetical protein AABW88_03400 [Nanoarchaeota archaeon]